MASTLNSFRTGPDERGHFGIFGGRFVAETLMPLILDLEKHYTIAKQDPAYKAELDNLLTHYVGRPSPLYYAERMTEHVRQKAAAAGQSGGAKIYFKREELNHTGAHKINNVLGQILLARRMGKTRIIAETGAGQHGVATATACARFGLECIVYMGSVDVARQEPNVFRMKLLGAKVVPVELGAKTLKDAMNEALRDWVTNVENTFYCIGTAAGSASLPRHGPRFPMRDRRGNKDADASCRRQAPGFALCLYRRRLQRHWPLSSVSSMILRWRFMASRRRASASTKSTPPRLPAAGRASSTAIAPIC